MYNDRSEPIDHYEDAYETIDKLRLDVIEAEDLEAALRKEIKALKRQLGLLEEMIGEKDPSVDTLHKMSRYFNLSMDETYEVLKMNERNVT
jgi:hypothetical protein